MIFLVSENGTIRNLWKFFFNDALGFAPQGIKALALGEVAEAAQHSKDERIKTRAFVAWNASDEEACLAVIRILIDAKIPFRIAVFQGERVPNHLESFSWIDAREVGDFDLVQEHLKQMDTQFDNIRLASNSSI